VSLREGREKKKFVGGKREKTQGGSGSTSVAWGRKKAHSQLVARGVARNLKGNNLKNHNWSHDLNRRPEKRDGRAGKVTK